MDSLGVFRLRLYIGIFGWHVGFFIHLTMNYVEMIMYGFWLLEIMKKVELGTCIQDVISEATLEAL